MVFLTFAYVHIALQVSVVFWREFSYSQQAKKNLVSCFDLKFLLFTARCGKADILKTVSGARKEGQGELEFCVIAQEWTLAMLVGTEAKCLKGVKVAVSGNPTFSELWLLIFRRLYLRYPRFSLPTLSWFSSLLTLAISHSAGKQYDAVLQNKLAWLESSPYARLPGPNYCFCLLYFHPWSSYLTP